MMKTVSDAVKEIAPPAIVSAATLFGMTLQSWVYIVTILFALARLMFLIPKAIGCGRCFRNHGTCTFICKYPPSGI